MKLSSKALLFLGFSLILWLGVHRYMIGQIQNYPSLEPLEPAAAAVLSQDTDELRKLAKQGFDLNKSGTKCETLLSIAVSHKLHNSLTTLLQLRADANLSTKQCGAEALYVASLVDDSSYLRTLLDYGGSSNARNSDGDPRTITAAGAFRWDNFWLLIDRGADVNILDREDFTRSGFTLLGSLATVNQFEQVYKLIQRGANPRLLPGSGTSLAYFTQHNGIDPKSSNYAWMQKVKQLMISQGININVPKYGPPPRINGRRISRANKVCSRHMKTLKQQTPNMSRNT